MDNYIFFKSTKISILTMFTLHHSLYHTSIIMKLSYSLDSIDIFKLVINLKLSFQNSSQNWESSRVYQVTIKSCDHKLIAVFFLQVASSMNSVIFTSCTCSQTISICLMLRIIPSPTPLANPDPDGLPTVLGLAQNSQVHSKTGCTKNCRLEMS